MGRGISGRLDTILSHKGGWLQIVSFSSLQELSYTGSKRGLILKHIHAFNANKQTKKNPSVCPSFSAHCSEAPGTHKTALNGKESIQWSSIL